jgi:hypothetical protein
MEDSLKLTDTQSRLLAAASQRDDRALEWPSNLTGVAACKVVAKLLAEGLIEEIQSRGSLPVWRREGDIALITKRGLQAIRVDEETTAADTMSSVGKRSGASTKAGQLQSFRSRRGHRVGGGRQIKTRAVVHDCG